MLALLPWCFWILGLAHSSESIPFRLPSRIVALLRNHSSHLPTTASPECFTFTLAPPLKAYQCNDELEWFLDERRRYDYLELVGANAPYTYTRSHPEHEGQGNACFVTITADDLFVTDQFSYKDVADFAAEILRECRDGRVVAGKGGVVKMTDGRGDWGGFYLRVDAWNPYPGRSAGFGTRNETNQSPQQQGQSNQDTSIGS